MIVLAYLGPFALIPFLVEKTDAEVQWHSRHGLVLFGADIVISILLTIISTATQYSGVRAACITIAVPGFGIIGQSTYTNLALRAPGFIDKATGVVGDLSALLEVGLDLLLEII